MTGQPMDSTTPNPWASDASDFIPVDLPPETTVSSGGSPAAVPYYVPAPVPAPALAAEESWPTREMMAGHRGRFRHAATTSEPTKVTAPLSRRRPGLSLAAVVVLSLLAAFFAWVTAEPLWLALGHGDVGTATVTQCVGTGVGQRCVGDFTAIDGTLVERVTLLGVGTSGAGSSISARMVGVTSDQAYVGAALHGLHLRWLVGFALTMLCGLGIALATGSIRIPDRRSRRFAVGISLGAPLLLMVGFLAATF
ncbi:hypothetical protein F4553_003838 [Allocatelliglobosispora scoriae]|uniref:Uncharacterized protein n=1 Tax=Allocatelliglobosispora scoriae TaxID=643052 RepID=A0A841BTH4_9ACTN|nr:hypothetical protein [Allocatelliglobosispora scoriae]MBB5870459.1 hypothetical protein [Allocatelliglobosispora scoriae]